MHYKDICDIEFKNIKFLIINTRSKINNLYLNKTKKFSIYTIFVNSLYVLINFR
jgi:hypothetical protein